MKPPKKRKRKAAPKKKAARKNPRRSIRLLKKKLKRMGRTRAQRRETVGHVKRLSRSKNPAPRKAKFNTWYKGPKGTRVRVRRVRGKIVVDVKK